MVKIRFAWLSNVKLLLIFLVVAGHCMEQTGLTGSIPYKIIYLFHMPAFAFLSGTGLKTRERCLKSALSAAVTYAAAQGTVVLYGKMTGETGSAVSWLTPYWHLWYLLSLAFWSVLVWGYYVGGETVGRVCGKMDDCQGRGDVCRNRSLSAGKGGSPIRKSWWILCFSGAVAAALSAGVFSLGRFLSMGRTFSFFPYVLLGVFFSQRFSAGVTLKQKIRLGAAGLSCLPFIVLAVKRPGYLWLYRADCYRQLHLKLFDGILLRILCFPAAAGLFLLVLACAPAKRLAVTRIGGDTLPIYLLHVIPVGFIGAMPCFSRGCSIWLVFFGAAAITGGIWLIFSWFRPLYGVTQNNKTNVRKTIAK